MKENPNHAEEAWAKFPNPVEKGLSVFGSKTLTLTPSGKLQLTDSGGLGAAQSFELSLQSSSLQLFAIKGSRRIRGLAHFGKEVWAAFELPSQCWPQIRQHLTDDTSSNFDSLVLLSCSSVLANPEAFASSAEIELAAMPDLLLKASKKKPLNLSQKNDTFTLDSEATLHLSTWLHYYLQQSPVSAMTLATYEMTKCGEFYARVLLQDNRLVLRRGQRIAQIPLDILDWDFDTEKNRLKIHNQLVVCGQMAKELSVDFVSAQQAQDFLERLAKTNSKRDRNLESSGISEIVHLCGLITQEREIDQEVDCRLSDFQIDFLDLKNGQILETVSLQDPGCRVTGTSERFVVFSSKLGPLAISQGAETFRQRVLNHSSLQKAAKRHQDQGPFALQVDSTDVTVVLEENTARLRGVKISQSFHLKSLTNLGCSRLNDGRLCLDLQLDHSKLKLSGDLEQVRGLHLALREQITRQKGIPRPELLCKKTLGLEGDYFLYTIFSPFYHTKRLLPDPEKLSQLSTEEAMEHLVLLSQACVNILRHLRMVVDYLPTFVSNRDRELLGPPIDSKRQFEFIKFGKEQETALRQSFMQIHSLLGSLQRISSLISTKTGFRASKPDYGPLAISLVGASLFSPLCLLAGAQHAYSASSRGAQQEKQLTEAVFETLQQCTGLWRDLTNEQVPLLSYHVIESIFGHRRRWAKHLQNLLEEQPAQSSERMLRRSLTLELFFCYPEDITMNYQRSEIVTEIKKAREVLSYEPFQRF